MLMPFVLLPAVAAEFLSRDIVPGVSAEEVLLVCDASEEYVELAYPDSPDSAASCTVLRDAERGRVVARRAATLVTIPFGELDTEAAYVWAEEEATRLLVDAGVTEDQIGRVTARATVMRSSDADEADRAVGLTVWFERWVDGYRVPSHGARVQFEVDGSLREVSLTWPSLLVTGATYASETVCGGSSLDSWVAAQESRETVVDLSVEDVVMTDERLADGMAGAYLRPLVSYSWHGAVFSKRFERTCNEGG